MNDLQDALSDAVVLNIAVVLESVVYDRYADLVQPYLDTVKAARKYQDLIDIDIDKWIEAEGQIAKTNGEMNWRRVHQSQARNLLTALDITEPDE